MFSKQGPTIPRVWIDYGELSKIVSPREGRNDYGEAHLEKPEGRDDLIVLEDVPVSWIYFMNDDDKKTITLKKPYKTRIVAEIKEE